MLSRSSTIARALSRGVPRCSASLIRYAPNKATTKPASSTVVQNVVCFSSGSHDDFAPQKKKEIEGEEEALKIIESHVKANPIMLYMKGTPSMPMCGFSAKVVQTLQNEGVDFSSVNVLDYPSIREAVKKYSDWPTIPQLYVNGEFVGGCDIVSSMAESGELKEVLAEVKKD